jgi:hypothetical protein
VKNKAIDQTSLDNSTQFNQKVRDIEIKHEEALIDHLFFALPIKSTTKFEKIKMLTTAFNASVCLHCMYAKTRFASLPK